MWVSGSMLFELASLLDLGAHQGNGRTPRHVDGPLTNFTDNGIVFFKKEGAVGYCSHSGLAPPLGAV